MKCFEQSERDSYENRKSAISVLMGLEKQFRDVLELNLKTDEDDMKYWLERVGYARTLLARTMR